MNLQERIDLLVKLVNYLKDGGDELAAIKEKAERQNGWFTQLFIDTAVDNIANHFLDAGKLQSFIANYSIPAQTSNPKNIGLVMAGNIPLVGFHDWFDFLLQHSSSPIFQQYGL